MRRYLVTTCSWECDSHMREDRDGKYIKYSDVTELEAENRRLSACDRLASREIERLKAENDELLKTIDDLITDRDYFSKLEETAKKEIADLQAENEKLKAESIGNRHLCNDCLFRMDYGTGCGASMRECSMIVVKCNARRVAKKEGTE